jgi:hypothetical protein
VTTEHYYDDGVRSGRARCRAGHELALPDTDFGTWCAEHEHCEPAATTGQPIIVAVHIRGNDGALHGSAYCRGGHTLALPDEGIGDWHSQHEHCQPGAQPPAWVAVPGDGLTALTKVAEYVSLGRGAVGHQPGGMPYPDATARRALGVLDDAGLHKLEYER